jgi:pyruvate dehydrogenase E1 component alpha subunit
MTATEPFTGSSAGALPSDEPLALIAADGSPVEGSGLRRPADDVVLDLYSAMVLGRRFDAQATALTKQGRLAVYPSSRGPGGVPGRSRSRTAGAGLAVSRPIATASQS